MATNLDKIQTGQVLYARVIEQLPTKNEVVIRLGEHTLIAKSDIQHTIGQTLKVLVEKTANELILKTPAPVTREDTISSTLRQLLPKQNPIGEFQRPLHHLLTSINSLSSSSTTLQTAPIAAQLSQLKSLSIDLLSSMPNKDVLTSSQGLKTAIQHSGVFLEPKLAKIALDLKTSLNANPKATLQSDETKISSTASALNNAANTTNTAISRVDLKANLIKLIQLLQSWPKPSTTQLTQQNTPPQTTAVLKTLDSLITQNQVLTQTNNPAVNPRLIPPALDKQFNELILKAEGALAKITLNQLTSVTPENSTTRQSWQLEIPFFNQQLTDSIFLTIERDASSKKKQTTEPVWTVSLEMNPPKLGLIKSKITLTNNKITSNFWTEDPTTRTLIHDHLTLLKDQFKRADLEAENIQVFSGPGPTIQAVKPSVFIFNEKA
ncbi:MAG: flagellar hook-length control protein FliK [Cycloclasticus sp.]|nr:flagellar hook-length control protein FliK [Cycloclasticus sp.]